MSHLIMDLVQLNVQKRNATTKAKELRWSDIIPAQFYGEGMDNLSLQMDHQTFRKLYRQVGESTIIDLHVEGEKAPLKVLVHEVQRDPVTDSIIHVDFVNVRMDREVHTMIPIHVIGESPAVKNFGGVLINSLTELEVKCLPNDLIHSVDVDVSGLEELNHSLHVKDLNIPKAIHVLTDMDRTVVTIAPPKTEQEETTVAPVAEAAAAKSGESGDQK